MRKSVFLLVTTALSFTTGISWADGNAAVGAVLGAGIGGYAGSKATKDGKPVKNGAAYGTATGAILGALLAPSDETTDNNTSPPQQRQTAPSTTPQIVYVVEGPQAYTNARVMMQERAYWQGYRDAQRYRYPRYGCEYGGFRYRDEYCRY